MRMSCNGCRVLRKGCSEDCSIRPCLQWIKSSESQANATLFLAKFYGRAGLLNLINAGPQHLRPAIFQSMLYEACGRIVNPIYGSVGLLWSGNWQLCQSAVEAILNGDPIKQISSEDATAVSSSSSGNPNPPFKAYDIRHVFKDDKKFLASQERHRVKTTRNRFKRAGNGSGSISKPKSVSRLNAGHAAELVVASDSAGTTGAGACNLRWKKFYPMESEEMVKAEPSHDSSVSQQEESMVSVETVEGSGSGCGSVVNRVEMEVVDHGGEEEEDVDGSLVNLDLTLGLVRC